MDVRKRNYLATAFLAVLLLALPVAAVIQTRWLNAASEAEADRMQHALGNMIRQIRAELAFELATIVTLLPPTLHNSVPVTIAELSRTFPSFLAAWRDRSRFPELINEIAYVEPGQDGAVYRYNSETGQFLLVVELDDWLNRAIPGTRSPLPNGGHGPDPLTMAIPLNSIVDPVRRTQDATLPGRSKTGFLLIHLDRDYLATAVVPELAVGYLGAGAGDYTIAVVDNATEELIWSNKEIDYAAFTDGDVLRTDEILSISTRPVLNFGAVSQVAADAGTEVANDVIARIQGPLVQHWLSLRRRGDFENLREDDFDGLRAWTGSPTGLTVLVRHNAGSIKTAARIERNRNLFVSFSILGLLAATTISFYLLFQRANRLREREHEFVATVTHELRTPVAAIHAAADNLAEGIITRPDQVKEYGKAMLHEGRRLRTMIDQVLLYAGMQGSSEARRLTEIKLDELVARTCSQIPELSRDHLIIRIEPQLPGFRGDPIAIESIIRNLVSNAAKHNDESTTISLKVGADHGSPVVAVGGRFSLVIEVTDTGRGIPRRELHRVREPFYRGAQSQADQVPGSGLGLSLVAGIADTYGGSLTVSSPSGGGTTVTVRLPFERGEGNGS
ncbi:MAG: HAMP domain-containing sensor histidine kinase [Spirochaetia bacterium]